MGLDRTENKNIQGAIGLLKGYDVESVNDNHKDNIKQLIDKVIKDLEVLDKLTQFDNALTQEESKEIRKKYCNAIHSGIYSAIQDILEGTDHNQTEHTIHDKILAICLPAPPPPELKSESTENSTHSCMSYLGNVFKKILSRICNNLSALSRRLWNNVSIKRNNVDIKRKNHQYGFFERRDLLAEQLDTTEHSIERFQDAIVNAVHSVSEILLKDVSVKEGDTEEDDTEKDDTEKDDTEKDDIIVPTSPRIMKRYS